MTKKQKVNNDTDITTGYSLSRAWFDFAFENQGRITANHGCMLMWFIEQNNRLGWAKEFGVPREQTKVATGITSDRTYKKVFDDLVGWGFIIVIQASKNQHTANIISLLNFDSSQYKSLGRSLYLSSQNNDLLLSNMQKQAQEQQPKQVKEQIQEQEQKQVLEQGQRRADINKPYNLTTLEPYSSSSYKGENENFENENYQKEKIEENAAVEILDDTEKSIPVDFALNEEEFIAAEKFLISHSIFGLVQMQHKTSKEDTLAYFRAFFEQKTAFGELLNKKPLDVLKHFYSWVPKYKRALTENKPAAKNGATNFNTGKHNAKATDFSQRRAERDQLDAIANAVLYGAQANQ